MLQQVYNYFVIDTRAHRDFLGGSVLGAYNLNARLIVGEFGVKELLVKTAFSFR